MEKEVGQERRWGVTDVNSVLIHEILQKKVVWKSEECKIFGEMNQHLRVHLTLPMHWLLVATLGSSQPPAIPGPACQTASFACRRPLHACGELKLMQAHTYAYLKKMKKTDICLLDNILRLPRTLRSLCSVQHQKSEFTVWVQKMVSNGIEFSGFLIEIHLLSPTMKIMQARTHAQLID